MIEKIYNNIIEILSFLSPEGVPPISWFLTFLMLFSVIYLLLLRSKVFSKPGVAIVLSFVIAWFGSSSAFLINFISSFFPYISLLIIVIVILLVVIFLFHKEDIFDTNTNITEKLTYFFIFVVFMIFLFSLNPFLFSSFNNYLIFSISDLVVIFLFIVVVFILWYLSK